MAQHDPRFGLGRALLQSGNQYPPGYGMPGGYQAGPDPTSGAPTPGMPMGGSPEGMMGTPPGYAGGYYGASPFQVEGEGDQPEPWFGKRIWDWVKENPGVIAESVGAGIGLWQQGKERDRAYGLQERRTDLEEEDMRQRAEEREQERQRRRRAYLDIVTRRGNNEG